jgi:hypothetical protein
LRRRYRRDYDGRREPDQAVTEATSMVVIRAAADPVSAPLHEWCGRAAAAVLAAEGGWTNQVATATDLPPG